MGLGRPVVLFGHIVEDLSGLAEKFWVRLSVTFFVEMVGGWLPDLEEPFAEVHGGDEDETVVPNPFGDEYYDVLE